MSHWLFLSLVMATPAIASAASKETERPDREMLRVMELLRDMEVIKNTEMMKDMQQVEQAGDQAPRGTAQTTLPAKKKEAAK